MFRFTIRDVLWLMVVVALAVGWWINWYRWTDANETLRDETTDLRAANFKLGFELVAARSYPHGEKRIRELYESGKKSPLSADEAREVLFEVMHAEDFRIRVRAMAILPNLRERDEAIAALRLAIRERGEEGIIPTYAASYLATLKATDAINDVREWLAYLESEQPYDSDTRETHIYNAKKRLAELSCQCKSCFREGIAMMRFRLRTLLIVLALGPPVIWIGWIALAERKIVIKASPDGVFDLPAVPPGHHWEWNELEDGFLAVPNKSE